MTRKKRKGYLGGDFRREPGSDSPDPLELVSAAEGTERITIRNDARSEARSYSAKRLDLGSGGDVEVDNRGNDRLGRSARLNEMNCAAFALRLLLRSAAVPDRVNGLDLRIERAPSCSVDWCLAVEHGDAARSRAEDDHCAEE